MSQETGKLKLTDVLSRRAIVPSLKALDKRGIVTELVAALKKAYPDEKFSAGDVVGAIMDREEVGSTGLHGGVAIPHAHVKAIKAVRAAFGRSIHPVDFRALDGEATYLFFLVVSPPTMNETYLQVLRQISMAIKGSHFCKFLRAAKNAKEIEEILGEAEETARV